MEGYSGTTRVLYRTKVLLHDGQQSLDRPILDCPGAGDGLVSTIKNTQTSFEQQDIHSDTANREF